MILHMNILGDLKSSTSQLLIVVHIYCNMAWQPSTATANDKDLILLLDGPQDIFADTAGEDTIKTQLYR